MSLRKFVVAAVPAAVIICGWMLITAAATNATNVTDASETSTVGPNVATSVTTTPDSGKQSTTTTTADSEKQSTTHLPRHASTTGHQQPLDTDHGVTEHPVQHSTASDHDGHHNTGHATDHTGKDTNGHGDEHEHKCPPEGEEGLRYVVAKFDFDYVRYPMIVAVWILFVTYAKIGNVQQYAVC